MVGKIIKEQRALDCVEAMQEGYFWTFTTADVVDLATIRERWRAFRHELQRSLCRSRYIMNYEIHPRGHGWHIHCVFDVYYPVSSVRRYSSQFGFGRVHVRKISSTGISLYISKHCMKAYRISERRKGKNVQRVRLVNVSRGLPSLSSYSWDVSDDEYKAHFEDWRSFLRRVNLLPKNIGVVKYNFLLSVGSFYSFGSSRPFTEIVKEIY